MDQCNLCIAHEQGNLNEVVWKQHIQLKERNKTRKEKPQEKSRTQGGNYDNNEFTSCEDSITFKCKAIYFKTKLSCHNFTIYRVANYDCTCYWFTKIDRFVCINFCFMYCKPLTRKLIST